MPRQLDQIRLIPPSPKGKIAHMNTQRMTLDEYITKHGLEPLRTWPPVSNQAAPIASVFITYEEGGKTKDFPDTDKFQIYGNKERTRFVTKNLTKNLFRIVHNELVPIKSQWEPANSTYEIQPIG